VNILQVVIQALLIRRQVIQLIRFRLIIHIHRQVIQLIQHQLIQLQYIRVLEAVRITLILMVTNHISNNVNLLIRAQIEPYKNLQI
jgi:hypothetical protein